METTEKTRAGTGLSQLPLEDIKTVRVFGTGGVGGAADGMPGVPATLPDAPAEREYQPYVVPSDLRVLWLPEGCGYGVSLWWSAAQAGAPRALFYRLTPAVWAWIWQRAVKLEDMVTAEGREEYRNQYRQLCERIAPLMAWVDRQERAGVEGWAGGVWRGIVRPKLPVAEWCPGWVGVGDGPAFVSARTADHRAAAQGVAGG
jgi:hypothetical protein